MLAEKMLSMVTNPFFVYQTLNKEEYTYWLQRHLEAETSIQGREELLFESALRLETNLQLLGEFHFCPSVDDVMRGHFNKLSVHFAFSPNPQSNVSLSRNV